MQKIEQKQLYLLFSIAFCVVLLGLFLSTYYMSISVESQREAEQNKMTYQQISQMIQDVNDVRIEESKNFVITGNPQYLTNFFATEKLVADIEDQLTALADSQISQQELRYLNSAYEYMSLAYSSDIRALRLKVNASNNSALLVEFPELAVYRLNIVEEALSSAEQENAAVQLLFGEERWQENVIIAQNLQNFRETVAERLDSELSQAQELTQIVIRICYIALFFFAGLLISLLYILYRYTIKPILSYHDSLMGKKKPAFPVAVAGSAETVLLGESLNTFYEKVQEADAAKDNFVSSISHEIRTPLTAINGFIDLLTTSKLDKKQKEYVLIIQESANNLLRIINNILDFSKIQQAETLTQDSVFNLKELLDRTIQMCNIGYQHTNKIHFHYLTKEEWFRSNQKAVYQVVTNLLSNAIKFTQRGDIYVEVTLTESYRYSRPRCQIVVRDTGMGIEEEDVARIFDSFEQVSKNNSSTYSGTGLGLTISKRLASALNGSLTVSSRKNQGTTFTFNFPIYREASVEETGESQKIEAVAGRVLVIQDNETTRLLLRRMLEKEGLQVEEAADGYTAMQLADSKTYDLILLDINLPDYSGFEVNEVIRQTRWNQETYVVALTADIENKKKVLKSSIDQFMILPIIQEEWAELLTSRLAKEEKSFTPTEPVRILGEALYQQELRRLEGQLDELSQQWSLEEASYSVFHDLKSAAGTLGLLELSEVAQKIMSSIKNNQFSQCKDSLHEELVAVVKTTQETIQEYLAEHIAVQEPASENKIDLQLFIRYLADYDGLALNYFNEHRGAFEQSFTAERFAGLANAIEAIDFETAIEILKGE